MSRTWAFVLAVAGLGLCSAATALSAYLVLTERSQHVPIVWTVGMLAGVLCLIRAESIP